jgi:hypothetical protein
MTKLRAAFPSPPDLRFLAFFAWRCVLFKQSQDALSNHNDGAGGGLAL